eukprot:g31841.t1
MYTGKGTAGKWEAFKNEIPRVQRQYVSVGVKGKAVMSEVPEDWELANMMPLFKECDKEKPGNYRLVSLTSVVGKLLEGILRDRVYMYLETQELIRHSQHGFVHGKPCLTNLIEFFEEVKKKIDEGRAVDVIYMDFSKTFDKAPH